LPAPENLHNNRHAPPQRQPSWQSKGQEKNGAIYPTGKVGLIKRARWPRFARCPNVWT
jgi:hypothetical protein